MTPEQAKKLEQLAYECARSDIECYCGSAGFTPGGRFPEWNISQLPEDPDEARAAKNAVVYLDYRGLLRRRIDNPNIVIILDNEQ